MELFGAILRELGHDFHRIGGGRRGSGKTGRGFCR